jgi:hypothetical protein
MAIRGGDEVRGGGRMAIRISGGGGGRERGAAECVVRVHHRLSVAVVD